MGQTTSAMLFGISIDDVLTVSSAIKSTISSLRAARGASTQYEHLITSEIESLENTLLSLDAELNLPDLGSEGNGIRLAIRDCKDVLGAFLVRLRKYEVLAPSARMGIEADVEAGRDVLREPANIEKKKKLVKAGRALQWGFSMDEEVRRFREKLAPRVTCL